MLSKKIVFDVVKETIESKIKTIQSAFDDLQSSLNSESKSSAGDKHETGRAMAQLEQEKLGGQLNQLLILRNVISNLNPVETSSEIQHGSLVETSNGYFYLSVGIGKIQIENTIIFCLSMNTPLGQVLIGKKKGDDFLFNSMSYSILEVT